MKGFWFLILAIVSVYIFTGFNFKSADKISVSTTEGVVVGEKHGHSFVFKGIPYATPPIGALRFKPPQRHARWKTPLQANAYGEKCLQIPAMTWRRKIEGSEDCLYLNVWQPTASGAKPLPVMIFIHGGGNFFGSGSDSILGGELYNGQYLAENGPAVVVNINYRLGPMGFLAHPALSRESGYGGSGNYAIMDQIAAIQWVKENAAAFGGDASNMTVFGQSAGGIDISILLASPLAHGLFAKAILESALMTDYPLSQTEANGVKLSTDLGCETAANPAECLRALSGDKILSTAYTGDVRTSFQSAPTIDGRVLTQPVIDTLRNGNSIPLIIGSNADELTTFGTLIGTDKVTTPALYAEKINQFYGPNGASVLAVYPPPSQNSDLRNATEVLLGDDLFHCNARRIARAVAGSAPVWRYVFSHISDNFLMASYRAGHTFELLYIFHSHELFMSKREVTLANTMSRYWLNFAETGNPNSQSQPTWTAFQKDEILNFDIKIADEKGFRDKNCDFWDSLNEK